MNKLLYIMAKNSLQTKRSSRHAIAWIIEGEE